MARPKKAEKTGSSANIGFEANPGTCIKVAPKHILRHE